jgi:K+-sensing histidine kinase KdpD
MPSMSHPSADALPSTGTESVEALTGKTTVQRVLKTLWTPDNAREAMRAPLRVYLGAAPGVGKTYAMLSEARRRGDRGTDALAGFVQTYGRLRTASFVHKLIRKASNLDIHVIAHR